MKRTYKALSLVLTLLFVLAILSACAKTPTPDEIFTEIDEASGAKMVVEMEFTDMMTTTVTVEGEGDKAYVEMDMEVLGTSTTQSYYTEEKDGKLFTYTKDGDDWTVTETEASEEEEQTSLAFFKALFSTESYGEYDKETRRYTMKEDVTVELDGMTCSEGYIEIGEDGTYTVSVKLAQTVEGVSLTGSMTLTISKIGEVTVTLPETK